MENNQNIEINYSDNFFTETEQRVIYEYCLSAPYQYGETDNGDHRITGMTHNVPETEFIYKLIAKTLYDRVEFIRNMRLYRMYINCFAPSEQPNFHIDGEGCTFLYFPFLEQPNLDEGGETQFFIEDNIYGIRPIPNRMIIFDGMIQHRATAFRSQHRFSLAIKYAPN